MLIQLHQKGPETVGIFRRGPNVRMMRDLRERLDEGEEVDWTEISVFVTAALLKDLLRSLPDCMLLSEDYSAWAEAATGYQAEKNIDTIKSLVERLPPANHHLLRHILFILNETAENNQVILKLRALRLKLCALKLRNWRALFGNLVRILHLGWKLLRTFVTLWLIVRRKVMGKKPHGRDKNLF